MGGFYFLKNRHQGPNQDFGQMDKVLVRFRPGLLPRNASGQPVRDDTLIPRRNGNELFLTESTAPFEEPYRGIRISVTKTDRFGNVHQAKVRIEPIVGTPSCGLGGPEAAPIVAGLLAWRRRRRTTTPRTQSV